MGPIGAASIYRLRFLAPAQQCFELSWPDCGRFRGVTCDNLIKDLNLKAESVPLLAGELVNADQQGACASMNAIIAELPKTIPNSYVISSKGCTSRPDHLHFNPAGYRELGRHHAVQMLSLLGYKTTEPAAVKNLLPATGMAAYSAPRLSVAITGKEPTEKPRFGE